VRPFEGAAPLREVSFVTVREHLRREVADAIIEAIVDALPQELVVTGTKKTKATQRARAERESVVLPFPVAR
jgi:hypothetical protein